VTARGDLHTAGRELHRTWFLWWRIPVAAWHVWRASRHRALAEYHRTAGRTISADALALSRRYPSLYWKDAA
jgi:hypothetical protein